MIVYPQDFRSKQNNNQFNVSTLSTINHFEKTASSEFFNNTIKIPSRSIWKRYCINSTVHGLRYLADPKLKTTERYYTAVVQLCKLVD